MSAAAVGSGPLQVHPRSEAGQRPTRHEADHRPTGPAIHPPVRVLVVAHDIRVRESIASLIATDDRLALAGTASTADQARRVLCLAEESVDVIVVDVARPAGAIDHAFVRELVEHPAGPFTVVSLSFDAADEQPARAAGAVAHLTKPCAPEEIITVLAGAHPDALPDDLTRSRPPSLGRSGIALAILAMFVPPWLFWFSAVGQAAGIWHWRLPQGAALWSLTVPVVAVVALCGGRAALADLWSRLTRWRVSPTIYAAAVGTPVLVASLSAAVAVLLGSPSPVGLTMSLPGALAYLTYGTGLFLLTEELAWRGVLLPRLQGRMGPLSAAVVVGVVWGLWHVPLLMVPGQPDHALPLLGFLLLIVPTSVLITALVTTARGSVVVAAVFHASFDAAYSWFGVVGVDHRPFWAAVALTWVAAISVARLDSFRHRGRDLPRRGRRRGRRIL